MTHGLHSVLCFVKEAWIILHEADKRDFISDFPDTDILAAEHGTQVDLAVANADPAGLGHADGPIVGRNIKRRTSKGTE